MMKPRLWMIFAIIQICTKLRQIFKCSHEYRFFSLNGREHKTYSLLKSSRHKILTYSPNEHALHKLTDIFNSLYAYYLHIPIYIYMSVEYI